MKNLIGPKDVVATINDIHDWIIDAQKGEEACYFIGELSRARIIDQNNKTIISDSANHVWGLHKKGLVNLVQKKGQKTETLMLIKHKSEMVEKMIRYHAYHYIMQRTDLRQH